MKRSMCIILCLVSYHLSMNCSYGQVSADAAATGISRAFNPALSVNALFDGLASNRSKPLLEESGLKGGLHYQEICLEMSANVDVYLQSKVAIAAEEEGGLEVEEAYVSTLRMPIPVIIRGGKMLSTFGRHNLYHLHHMAFAEPPMILEQVFGPNLNEVSVEASYLAPVPWYMDITAGLLDGKNARLFESEKPSSLAYLCHLDNLWDLTDEVTLRLGGSFLTGQRGLHYGDAERTPIGPDTVGISSRVWGADFHLKWRPLEFGRYHSFTLQGEYVHTQLDIDGRLTGPLHGFFLQALGQISLMWWLQARYDWFDRSRDLHGFFPEPANLSYDQGQNIVGNRWSFSIAFVPTEFSAYRLQYNMIDIGGHKENQILAQVNVTIGSHPAHTY
jgi:hypothetical protein